MDGRRPMHIVYIYTSYEGLNLANQISRKLRAFDRKLEGSYTKKSFVVLIYIRNKETIILRFSIS